MLGSILITLLTVLFALNISLKWKMLKRNALICFKQNGIRKRAQVLSWHLPPFRFLPHGGINQTQSHAGLSSSSTPRWVNARRRASLMRAALLFDAYLIKTFLLAPSAEGQCFLIQSPQWQINSGTKSYFFFFCSSSRIIISYIPPLLNSA